jgi:beta-glucosidase
MGSAMCVMNRVNGVIGCENDHILNGLLKNETNFQGKSRSIFRTHPMLSV